MRVASVFSGIGGLDHGLHQAGFEHVLLCESDGWRRGVLRERFPGVPVYDDVRDVACGPREHRREGLRDGDRPGADEGAAEGGAVHLLAGGFPCQDVSVAGNRAGLAGNRSSLFFELARLTDAFRPRWVLVENVPGLFSSNGGRDFGVVLGTLADLGYGVAWRTLDSRFFGVPQRRRRVFILGTLADTDPRAAAERAGQVLAVGTRCDRHLAKGGEAGAGASEPLTVSTLAGSGKSGGWRVGADEAAGGQLVAAPLSHGSNPNSNMAGRRREDDVNLVAAFSENQRGELLEGAIARQLTSGGGKPGQGYSAVREGASVRRLTPVECERLQGLPDNWTRVPDTAPDSRRYAALGDAVTATVGFWLGSRIKAAA